MVVYIIDVVPINDVELQNNICVMLFLIDEFHFVFLCFLLIDIFLMKDSILIILFQFNTKNIN